MPDTYTTIQGDMWDWIAYKVYGNEACMGYLMQANPRHIDVSVFPQGITLICPDIKQEDKSFLPPWRR